MNTHEPPTLNAVADEHGRFRPEVAFAQTPVSFYSFAPLVVPMYVLDRLAQSEGRAERKVGDEEQYALYHNDAFVKSVNHNWLEFLRAVKMPEFYTADKVGSDAALAYVGQYSGPWEGDERLRDALSGTPVPLDGAAAPWLCFGFRRKPPGENATRHRLKAGYWVSDERRRLLWPQMKRYVVQNPLFPLLLRILILTFCCCALGLAITIYRGLRKHYGGHGVKQQPLTIFAIVVECLAIAYVIYIAYDEYLGKPLGLRNPLGKMKLIMLDMLFIICSLANLSLSFNLLTDNQWVCLEDSELMESVGIFNPKVLLLCRRQRALTAFILLVLVLWVVTFTISIIRVVVKVSDPR